MTSAGLPDLARQSLLFFFPAGLSVLQTPTDDRGKTERELPQQGWLCWELGSHKPAPQLPHDRQSISQLRCLTSSSEAGEAYELKGKRGFCQLRS